MSSTVPLLVKHMTLAILDKGGLKGEGKTGQFREAFAIARSRCATYGLIGAEGRDDPAKVNLTAKGVANEAKHRREREGSPKAALFDQLVALLDAEDRLAASKKQAGLSPTDPAPFGQVLPKTQAQRIVDKLRDAEERMPGGPSSRTRW